MPLLPKNVSIKNTDVSILMFSQTNQPCGCFGKATYFSANFASVLFASLCTHVISIFDPKAEGDYDCNAVKCDDDYCDDDDDDDCNNDDCDDDCNNNDCDNAVKCDDDDDGSGMHCIPPMGCICKMPPRREIYIYK